ncbi:MAG: TetR/AcrR family transcriptional regulator [Candidatus Cloacimonadales bacterium]|nr:TetR/AcrR family transcriptional regulator [Candidatus Cloacimonadales bacterium]
MNKTKEAIVKTALKLFLQKGFYHVSMNMIADEVGVSKPAIYHHFQNKDAMVEGVLDYFTEKMSAWAKKYYSNLKSGTDFVERMFNAIPIYKDVETVLLDKTAETYAYSYNDLLMILSKYKPEFRERIAEDQIHARQVLNQHLIDAQDANLIRTDLRSSQLATMIHAIIEGCAFICELDPNLNIKRVSNDMFEIVKKLINKENSLS